MWKNSNNMPGHTISGRRVDRNIVTERREEHYSNLIQ
jgi:hypothetical protein